MKQLFAVALVVGLVAAPAYAQHGGGGHGGGGGFHGGGFSGHAGFASPGGFARPGGFGGYRGYSVGYGGGRIAYAPRYGVQARAFAGGAGVSSARPGFYHRSGVGPRGYGYGVGYGLGYGYGPWDFGWLDADDTDSGDDGAYGAGPYDVGPYDDGSGVAAGGYGPQGYGPGYGPSDGPPPIPYTAQGAEPEQQPEQASNAPIVITAGPLYNDDAVTLVFKDGRAPETIHNYALTRTTLYVTDGRSREIPVAALDLAATERVNRAAGVDFQLPVTQ